MQILGGMRRSAQPSMAGFVIVWVEENANSCSLLGEQRRRAMIGTIRCSRIPPGQYSWLMHNLCVIFVVSSRLKVFYLDPYKGAQGLVDNG